MVKDQSDSLERKPATATSWATLSSEQQGIFHMHHSTDRISHIMMFVIPVVEHWLEQEIAQWVQHRDRSNNLLHHEQMFYQGMYYPVCGMVHIKEPLLLIDKSSLCGGSGFPFSLSKWSLTIYAI